MAGATERRKFAGVAWSCMLKFIALVAVATILLPGQASAVAQIFKGKDSLKARLDYLDNPEFFLPAREDFEKLKPIPSKWGTIVDSILQAVSTKEGYKRLVSPKVFEKWSSSVEQCEGIPSGLKSNFQELGGLKGAAKTVALWEPLNKNSPYQQRLGKIYPLKGRVLKKLNLCQNERGKLRCWDFLVEDKKGIPLLFDGILPEPRSVYRIKISHDAIIEGSAEKLATCFLSPYGKKIDCKNKAGRDLLEKKCQAGDESFCQVKSDLEEIANAEFCPVPKSMRAEPGSIYTTCLFSHWGPGKDVQHCVEFAKHNLPYSAVIKDLCDDIAKVRRRKYMDLKLEVESTSQCRDKVRKNLLFGLCTNPAAAGLEGMRSDYYEYPILDLARPEAIPFKDEKKTRDELVAIQTEQNRLIALQKSENERLISACEKSGRTWIPYKLLPDQPSKTKSAFTKEELSFESVHNAARFGTKGNQTIVTSVISGNFYDNIGLKKDDLIESIDVGPTKGLTLHEFHLRVMKGEIQDPVMFHILRVDEKQTIKIRIK